MTHAHANNAPEGNASPKHRAPSARIYAACLAAYNHGIVHGAWIRVTTPHDIMNQVHAMLAASPIPLAEEWAIHDYEGFEGAHLSEYASFDTFCQIAGFMAEHGDLGAQLYNHFGGDLSDARTALEHYAGCFTSAADFAENLHAEMGTDIPDSLQSYIDWQEVARDMALNGDIFTLETAFDELHVFWSL